MPMMTMSSDMVEGVGEGCSGVVRREVLKEVDDDILDFKMRLLARSTNCRDMMRMVMIAREKSS